MDHPLRPLTQAWIGKIGLAREHKEEHFGQTARLAMAFFNGPYDWFYSIKGAQQNKFFQYQGNADELPRPGFCMTVNKVSELVRLFGPTLYHRNPVRKVTPRKPVELPRELAQFLSDPAMLRMWQQLEMASAQAGADDKARAALFEGYLSWTPDVLGLKEHSRSALDEALTKGMGVLWTEPHTPAGLGKKVVGSFYDSVDNLQIDPDMESIESARFVARRCVHPWWEVESEYGLPEGTLKQAGVTESFSRQADVNAEELGDFYRKQGKTNDLVVYYKIYSKMGLGALLSGVDPALRTKLERYGQFCYLVVCQNVPYPLNLPPELLSRLADQDLNVSAQAEEEVRQRLQWPTPYWDEGEWPFTEFSFYKIPKEVWPQSVVAPGLGELMFINWAFSFLASKVKTNSRDFIAIAKSASEELKKAIKSGGDYSVVEIEQIYGDIDKVVKFLQHPQMNKDIWDVIEGVMENFEKRTGLTELMYGYTASSYRSAAEAEVKGDQVSIRPDDMFNKAEDAMSKIAAKEAFCARWHLSSQDVEPVLGQAGAFWWQQLVQSTDPSFVRHRLQCRVESGSARKPNKARDTANIQQAMQTFFQPFFQVYLQTGNPQQVNALIQGWGRAVDQDVSGYLLQPFAPPQLMPPATA